MSLVSTPPQRYAVGGGGVSSAVEDSGTVAAEGDGCLEIVLGDDVMETVLVSSGGVVCIVVGVVSIVVVVLVLASGEEEGRAGGGEGGEGSRGGP